LSIDDTKKQDHKAPSAGITCSMNELINQAWDPDFVSISQCLCFQISSKRSVITQYNTIQYNTNFIVNSPWGLFRDEDKDN